MLTWGTKGNPLEKDLGTAIATFERDLFPSQIVHHFNTDWESDAPIPITSLRWSVSALMSLTPPGDGMTAAFDVLSHSEYLHIGQLVSSLRHLQGTVDNYI